ncbi:MAG: heme-copper oxidase subunit III [Candidatus Eisenbacteria bacterium]|uniref:Heme-copper oxidase subunit III n=1 Tax=Eiseniibacteriota bacterium TaxID=2212470 RepID=A0A538UAU1_UNCEI|nr:MAG: heme-copper oxidase subunit III [Candidatus Eisenbacteria bacterium]
MEMGRRRRPGTARTITELRLVGAPPRRRFADNALLGTALFVFTEVMFFTGFVSAFSIVESGSPAGAWPPPGQPRLPILHTALNTLALLLSGVALFIAGRRFRVARPGAAERWMAGAVALGAYFVIAQGIEWMGLLRQGLTLTSSQLGSFFYVIVGTHALHAIVAILFMGSAWLAMHSGRLTRPRLSAVQLFWYFVVLVWPILYWKVYL